MILTHHITSVKTVIRPMSPYQYTAIFTADELTVPVSVFCKHPLRNEALFILLFSFLRVQMPALSLVQQSLRVCRSLLLPYAPVPWKRLGLH